MTPVTCVPTRSPRTNRRNQSRRYLCSRPNVSVVRLTVLLRRVNGVVNQGPGVHLDYGTKSTHTQRDVLLVVCGRIILTVVRLFT